MPVDRTLVTELHHVAVRDRAVPVSLLSALVVELQDGLEDDALASIREWIATLLREIDRLSP